MPYKDPEKRREAQKRFRERHKQELYLKNKKFREENRDKVNEWRRNYYWANREKMAEQSKRSHQKHKEKIRIKKLEHFRANKAHYYAKKREWLDALYKWVNDMKEEKGCRICGTKEKLEYHHIDPTTKVSEISFMLSQMKSRTVILEEIKKCEVLCNRCHIETHNIIGRKRKSDQ
jgi:hypothetical protein